MNIGCDPLVAGTAVSDKELEELYGCDEETDAVTVFGEINIDCDERAVLSKGPDFAIFQYVDKKRMQEEINIALIKIRWDRQSRDWLTEHEGEEGNKKECEMTERELRTRKEQEDRERQDDAEARMIFNSETNTVDMGSRRCTDMKHSQRLHLPRPRPADEEATLGARQEIWMRTTTKYMDEHCLERGAPKTNNLNAAERIGLTKIQKRIKAGEVTVLPSDKGKTFTISSLESYSRQGDMHTTADRMITELEVEQIQSRLNNPK